MIGSPNELLADTVSSSLVGRHSDATTGPMQENLGQTPENGRTVCAVLRCWRSIGVLIGTSGERCPERVENGESIAAAKKINEVGGAGFD